MKIKQKETILIINDVRSTHNVGAMFRTADAAGVDKIYLTGYTPAPFDRFGKERSDITKASLGSEKYVAWEAVKNVGSLLNKLKKEGFCLIALEQDKKSVDYKKIRPKNKTAIIVGNEVTGISKNILVKCDLIGEIPMRGKKESLNVSVSLGIFLFRILNI